MDPIRTLDVPAARRGPLELEDLGEQLVARFSFKKVFKKIEKTLRPVVKAVAPQVISGAGSLVAGPIGGQIAGNLAQQYQAASAAAKQSAVAGAYFPQAPTPASPAPTPASPAPAPVARDPNGFGGIPPALLLVGGALLVLVLGGRH